MTDTPTDMSLVDALQAQLTEDPRRAPHEKETTLTLDGDRATVEVTSFKRVVYEKLLRRAEFAITRVHVLDADTLERTVDSLDAVADDSNLSIIGVTGQLPVGAFKIGMPRNSESHADIVSV